MSECTHDCSTCSEACSSRQQNPQDLHEKPHELSKIGKVIAVVSGKGGVGKSLVTALTAVSVQRSGHTVGILDADITGPSVPKMFGITGNAEGDASGIFPRKTKLGTDLMSINLLLEDPAQPVIWRGPVIAGAVKQFWTDVIWGDDEYLFVDMPPGTGDVPLTVFQSIPVDGIIIVTTPQDLVSMIVEKAVKMAEMMNIPILGLVENMSYAECPDCGKRIPIFGESHIAEVAQKHGLPVLGQIPMNPKLAAACDKGMIELFEGDWLEAAVGAVLGLGEGAAQ
ncbi:MAG: Mrp/NBP35 family ATP-binding protein [Oscillospiraceae bacterium]|nr:Mrp/NBP35 family ATP-binding protein [Oscillospiraceae bacterium]